jgi:hypothetical protein
MLATITSPLERCYLDALSAQAPVVCEDGSPLAVKWSELELQALWYSGYFGSRFRLATGELLEVVQFGFWNREPGPDFVNATIQVDQAEPVHGDIELDLAANDWEAHGHSINPAFDRVVLHIFFRPPTQVFFTRTSQHRQVYQLILPEKLPHEPALVPAARLGLCRAPLRPLDSEQINDLLRTAARLRLQRKSELLKRAILVHGSDEAIFQAIAVALGFKSNKIAFLALAQKASLRFLRRHATAAEAILFGLSGFLEDTAPHQTNCSAYLEGLWSQWWRFRSQLEPMLLQRRDWRLTSTRPLNHPHRRIGALAIIARHWSQLRTLPSELRAVAHWLRDLHHPHWEHHFTLTAKPVSARHRLIGDSRINDIIANVFAPLFSLSSEHVWEELQEIAAQLDHRTLNLAATRLFGSLEAARPHLRRLYQQQGLVQIFDDFCLTNHSDCTRCRLPELVGRTLRL